MLSEVYPMYENKISKRGFTHIWRGECWSHIMPEAIEYVKSEEYIKKTRSFAGKSNSFAIHKEIQQKKKEGLKRLEVYELYKDRYTLSGFNKIWYKK